MGIDDIAREKAGAAGGMPRSLNEQNRQRRTQSASTDAGGQPASNDSSNRPRATRTNGSLQVEVPDPLSGDRDSLMFWMNVIQTLALVVIALRL